MQGHGLGARNGTSGWVILVGAFIAGALGCGAAPSPDTAPVAARPPPPAHRVIEGVALDGPFASVCEGVAAVSLDGADRDAFGALTCSMNPDEPDEGPNEPRSTSRSLAAPAPPFLEAHLVRSYSEGWGEQAGGVFLAVRTDAGWFTRLLALEAMPGGAGLITNPVLNPERDIEARSGDGGPRLIVRYTDGTVTDYQYGGPEDDDDGPTGEDGDEHALVCAARPRAVVCADLLVGEQVSEQHLLGLAPSFERRWTSELTLGAGDRVRLERSGDVPAELEASEQVELRLVSPALGGRSIP